MEKIILALIVLSVCLACGAAVAKLRGDRQSLDILECAKEMIKNDDGDTIVCGSEEVRILGIDTPEIKHPKHGIFEDQPFGREAAEFTRKLVASAKRVIIVRAGQDKYGRTLGHVLLDGELLGVKLIKAGLAYENVSKYGDNGLPEFALEIIEAWKVSPRPSFEDPHEWRKKNQKRP